MIHSRSGNKNKHHSTKQK